jgi:adenosylcobinamide kinase/adenosylcobinamide-phosphate guanylyltransferase
VTYVATAAPDDEDPDWTARIKHHRDRRPASWTTVETADIADVIANADSGQVLLVDCLTVWLSRVMDAADVWAGAWEGDLSLVDKQLDALLDACRRTRAQVVLVSNEVGQGIVPSTRSGRLYRDVHGRMNAEVARECDRVVAMWAGRAVEL